MGSSPNRRSQDAIAEIHQLSSGRSDYHWILEADIKACFDEIGHTALIGRLRVRIKDKRICGLGKAFLKSGIFTELGDREESLLPEGRGSILSPLLANIALSALDEHFDRQRHRSMGNDRAAGQAQKDTARATGNSSAMRTILS